MYSFFSVLHFTFASKVNPTDTVTKIKRIDVTYQASCRDGDDGFCDKIWTKEYETPVTKVLTWFPCS